MSQQPRKAQNDPHASRWNGMDESGRGAILAIALVRRSPKMPWDGLDSPVREKLRRHLDRQVDDGRQAAEQSGPSTIDLDAHKAATSPHSDEPMPSEAQMTAQNHKMGHTEIGGLAITIHHPEGSIRVGETASGVRWFSKLRHAHYGYLPGSSGADGEQVDVFVRPGTKPDLPDTAPVFLIEQIDPKTLKFDEWKALLGYRTGAEARQAYINNFPKNWKGFSKIIRMTLAEFKEWLASDKPSKPIEG